MLPSAEYRWNYNAPGTPLTLSYGFMATMPLYAQWNDGNNPDWFGNEWGTFVPFNATQQEAVHRAIQNYEDVCNVDFVYMANGDAADVRFGSAALYSWEAAHAYYPDRGGIGEWEGDVWFNTSDSTLLNQSPGSYGYFVTLHEIGHALGLKHPHDWDNGGTTLPFSEDTRQYTVMSYQEHPSYSIEPSSLLLYDIAALQYLYGANTTTRSGNTVYTWAANEQFIQAIWDGGGTDTIDASNQTRRVVIDLREGSFSSIGSSPGGDAVNNLAIAFNSVIENAIGGNGSDTITGNAVANRLEGGSADDTLRGLAGADILIGGSGNDTLYGGDGIDQFDGGSGHDIVSYADSLLAVGVADIAAEAFIGIEEITGTDYSDTLIALSGVTRLNGGGYADTLLSGAAGETLNGGGDIDFASYDNSTGGVLADLATGANSGVYALGDVYIDIEGLIGSAFADTLLGNAQGNHLFGGGGNDTLDGRSGVDQYRGGTGNDVFYIDSTSEYVTEYAGEGTDEVRTTVLSSATWLYFEVENLTFVGSGNFEGHGNSSNNVITGGAGADRLYGESGNDILIGGSGDDVLEGGSGADNHQGNAGFDFVSYRNSGPVTADLSGGTQAGDAAGDTFSGIEGIIGSIEVDTLIGDGGDNTFDGSGRGDTIDGRGGSDTAIYAGWSHEYEVSPEQNGVRTIRALRSSLDWEANDTLISIENIRFEGRAVNRAPIVSVESAFMPLRNADSHMSFLLSPTTDQDGDLVTRYEIRDTTAGAGHFRLNGVVQADNQVIAVTRSQLIDLAYRGGASPTDSDQVQIRASDGVDWSAWSTFTFAAVNRLPVVAAPNHQPAHGASVVAAATLFSVSDPDGDASTLYEFRDNTVGKGFFRVDNVVQSYQFQIAASQLASTQFVLSQTPGTSDSLQVRAFDGLGWSNWASFSVAAPPNAAPIASASDQTAPRGAAPVSAATLFSVTDPDGDVITRYAFWDSTSGNGFFRVNGVAQPFDTGIDIAAADLANTQFVLGAPGSSDTLWVAAYDGIAWGAWQAFSITAPPNNAPSATASNQAPLRGTQSIAASSLVSATDPDGDPIVAYQFTDWGTDAASGYFTVNGVRHFGTGTLEVAAASMPQVRFQLGSVWDQLYVRASDGSAWSDWQSITVTPPANRAPTAAGINQTPARSTTSLAASSLFSASDPDGDAIAAYQFSDWGTDAASGYFTVNGVRQFGTGTINLTAADLANTRFQLGTAPDTLYVRVSDGLAWSDWQSLSVTPPANRAPTATGINQTPARSTTFLAASSLFNASDPDGDAIVAYQFSDWGTDALSGYFTVNGTPHLGTATLDVSAAQLANTRFQLGTAPDTLYVRVSDGSAWSGWQSLSVTPAANRAPTATGINQAPARGTSSLAASSLFSASDPDGDAIVAYQFSDWGTDAASGYFTVNGTPHLGTATLNVSAADLASTRFQLGTAADTLYVRVSDGSAWSGWQSLNVSPPANQAPTVSAASPVVTLGSAPIPVAGLLTASDPDGDAIARYQFWDSGLDANSGFFALNGVRQSAGATIEIMANQLAQMSFVLGSNIGAEQLWVRASDGTSWAPSYSPFTVTTLAPT